MSVSKFVDSNIVLYSFDTDAGAKHQQAVAIMDRLWDQGGAIISTQVLLETYNGLTRKLGRPFTSREAQQIIRALSAWQVVPIEGPLVILATVLCEKHQVSIWDALVLAAAFDADASCVLTEDFAHERMYSSMQTIDPFRIPIDQF